MRKIGRIIALITELNNPYTTSHHKRLSPIDLQRILLYFCMVSNHQKQISWKQVTIQDN